MSQVSLKNVVKKYENIKVIHDLNLDIQDNEFIVLVGPSGCGKSTTLRMIAGLESISGGDILIGDRVVNDIPPKARNIAMVFQDYALYPHMTVYQNMSFSLKMKKTPADEIDKSVKRAADILGITNLLDRKPHALSGGQRQRVAMGRAIVRNPEVFLFDEPLSNLDAKLRTQMRMELKKLHMKLKTTTVYVTHDQVEAMTLADRIVIMKDGYIQQVGTPIEVYEQPANIFVARFIGNPSMNIVDGQVEKSGDGFVLKTGSLNLTLPKSYHSMVNEGQKVKVGIRPESITLSEDAKDQNGQLVDGEVIVSEITGSTSLLDISLGGIELVVEVEGRKVFKGGEAMKFHLNPDHMLLFDPESGLRLDGKRN